MARKRRPMLWIPLPEDARSLARLLAKLDDIYLRPEVAIEETSQTLVVTALGVVAGSQPTEVLVPPVVYHDLTQNRPITAADAMAGPLGVVPDVGDTEG